MIILWNRRKSGYFFVAVRQPVSMRDRYYAISASEMLCDCSFESSCGSCEFWQTRKRYAHRVTELGLQCLRNLAFNMAINFGEYILYSTMIERTVTGPWKVEFQRHGTLGTSGPNWDFHKYDFLTINGVSHDLFLKFLSSIISSLKKQHLFAHGTLRSAQELDPLKHFSIELKLSLEEK